MSLMHSSSRKSVSSAGKVLPARKGDTLQENISESDEQKRCPEMSVSEAQTPAQTSLVKPAPRNFWFNKLLLSLLGFCSPIACIPDCEQQCKPVMVCLPGQPQIAGQKEEKEEEELKPIGLITRNKEADFIGGKFIAGCTCGRKNGLQGDCPRISCRNNPGCTMNPPRCWPQFKIKPKPVPPPDQNMVCVPIQLVYYDPYNS